MDPVTIIVAALAAGATAGMSSIAEDSIKDAYAAAKQWLQGRYADISLKNLEKDPKSPNRRGVLAEELAEAGAGQDAELLVKVQALNKALAKSEEGRRAAEVVGVKIDELVVKGDAIIADIASSGSGVVIQKGEIGGSLEIRGVRAGDPKADDQPNP